VSKSAIALFVLAIALVVAGVVLIALRDVDTAPAASSTTASVAASPAGEPEVEEAASIEGSRSGATTMVAGFGLLGLWVVGGGVSLARARRCRSGTPEQDAV